MGAAPSPPGIALHSAGTSHLAVWLEREVPTAFMHESVMEGAQQHEVVQVCSPAHAPPAHVVGVGETPLATARERQERSCQRSWRTIAAEGVRVSLPRPERLPAVILEDDLDPGVTRESLDALRS